MWQPESTNPFASSPPTGISSLIQPESLGLLLDFWLLSKIKLSPFPLDLADDFFHDLHLPPLSSAARTTLIVDISEPEVAHIFVSRRLWVWMDLLAFTTVNFPLFCSFTGTSTV